MKRFWLGLCVGLMVLGSSGWAEEEKGDIKTLETMVVTAGRVEQKKSDVSTNITVITEQDIQESSAQDLGELLSYQGFMIREYPNSLTSVEVRGFRTETHGNDLASYVLILINGRRAGTGNLSKIVMNNVERVEIIRGPASVLYGSSAMGGIINVITKKGEEGVHASVGETLGSYNYRKTEASIAAGHHGVDLSLSASKESQSDYSTANGVTYYNTGFDNKERLSLNTGWTFMPSNRVGISYTGYKSEGVGSPSYLSSNDLESYTDNSIGTTDITYDGKTGSGLLGWSLRYFKGKDEYETYDNSYSSRSYFRDTDQEGAQGQLNINWKMAQVTTGFDWVSYEVENSYSEYGPNTYDNPAGFLLANLNFFDDRLIVSAGTRYDEFEVESDDGDSMDDDHLSASIGLVYKVLPQLSIRVNYADAFKMPTADQLYMDTDYGSMGHWKGNADLTPEKSKTYDIGVDLSVNAFYGSLTYFTSEFEDKIAYYYDSGESAYVYTNLEGASIDGLEGEIGFHMGDYFNWDYDVKPYVSFTCLTERKDEEDGSTLQYTPKWTGAYGIRIANPEKGFVSSLNVTYTDEQEITDYEGTGATTLSDMTVADLSITQRLTSIPSWGDLKLKAVIRNLFNEDYALVQGYPCPGRSFYVSLQYDY